MSAEVTAREADAITERVATMTRHEIVLEMIRLRCALKWAEESLKEARRVGLLGALSAGGRQRAAEAEFQKNMAPITKALREMVRR